MLEYEKASTTLTTYYGASFLHVAAPTKPIVGVVRDKDTGKPLAGVTIESNKLANDPVPGNDIVQTTTDAAGPLPAHGDAKGRPATKFGSCRATTSRIRASMPSCPKALAWTRLPIDFGLKRGIWIEGKVTDKVTGEPVQGSVDYFALKTNPNVRDHPGFDGTIPPYWGIRTKQTVPFRVVGLPGPGLIAVFYTGQHLLAPDRDDEYGTKEPDLYTSPRQLGPLINYTALARIDPAKGVESVKRDVTLDPGWTLRARSSGQTVSPSSGHSALV